MQSLGYHPNPVGQAYGGGDTIEVRQLQSFCSSVNTNFNTVEQAIAKLETALATLNHKLQASYDFIDWMRVHHQETLVEYKAHNIVTRAFDRAEHGPSEGYTEAMGS